MSDRLTTSVRVPEIDALRGLALFGILMVNVWFFADPGGPAGGPAGGQISDQAVRFLVATFFEGKFYLLFSLLFGYGFVVLRDSTTPHTVRVIGRRLAALGVLGVLHGLILFYGDILVTYALAGTLLLATRTMTTRARWATAAAITAGVSLLIIGSALLVLAAGPAGSGAVALGPGTASDTPGEAFAANAGTYGAILPSVVLFQGPLALAAFHAGAALAERGVLRPHPPSRRVLVRVAVVALPPGLAVSALQAHLAQQGGEGLSLLATGLSVAASPLVTIGYAAAFLLLLRSRPGRALGRVMAGAGRISLSNYLGQSLMLCLVFTGYGFGLADRVPLPAVPVVVVGLYALQLGASHLVLARFGTGPVEAALRRFVRRTPAL